jgi:hypothetical protein
MNEKHLVFYFFSMLVVSALIVGCSPSIAHAQANDSPPASNVGQPSIGTDIIGEFYGAHPNVKNNSTIAGFIGTYGISSWTNDRANANDDRYLYVYVLPVKNSSQKLVFLYFKPDSTGLNNHIVWVKLVGKDVTLAQTTDMQVAQVSGTPGFTAVTGIVSIVVSLLVINFRRKRIV